MAIVDASRLQILAASQQLQDDDLLNVLGSVLDDRPDVKAQLFEKWQQEMFQRGPAAAMRKAAPPQGAATAPSAEWPEKECDQCKKTKTGHRDPDTSDFFCVDCWDEFSADLRKCAHCKVFLHPSRGMVDAADMWLCNECVSQLD
mmetsp:Transcript_21618/g.47517  ORF Transcript_21618/g.47517 Transcript_21618/m.47517 type:complete len:145 (-) Transcript_21618:129-563(-)